MVGKQGQINLPLVNDFVEEIDKLNSLIQEKERHIDALRSETDDITRSVTMLDARRRDLIERVRWLLYGNPPTLDDLARWSKIG